MPARPFLLVQTGDQWLRSSHDATALDVTSGVVQLADSPIASNPRDIVAAAGLALDAECRLYHAVPERTTGEPPALEPARIDRILWATLELDAREGRAPNVQPLFAERADQSAGDFVTTAATGISDPRGLAVDAGSRLFIADAGLRQIVIVDLWRRRVQRRVQLSTPMGRPVAPVDVASRGRDTWTLVDDPPGLALFQARRGVRRVELPAVAGITHPRRVAISPEGILVVLDGTGAAARAVSFNPFDDGRVTITPEPFATDLEFDGHGALVIARRPGEECLRYAQAERTEAMSALKAADYDGAGIVRTPDGRIGYWATDGTFRHMVAARPHFVRLGRVTTYRLDSGEYQTVWGRLFLDACMPAGTDIRFSAVASDEPPDGPTQRPTLPANVRASNVLRPDLSPPLLPLALDVVPPAQPLFRRPNGRELPWAQQPADDPFETYEAPVVAGRGRFLWVTLELRGNGRRTPRLRSLRVEHPSHDYLRRLPATFSRDEIAESFLRRFLAPMEGALGELERRALLRMALVDARTAPAEVLPWLAGFIGLLLDERLPNDRRRRLVAEAVPLLRFRGTVGGLRRFIELSIGIQVHILEHFALHGFGPVLGYRASDAPTRSVLGSGFRIGGATDSLVEEPLAGAALDVARKGAHRFTVIVPGALSDDRRGILEHVLRLHRPAHTVGGYCTAGAGMRTGIGLHIGLTTVIGRSGMFSPALLGQWPLGRGVTIGRASPGTMPGAGQLGRDTRVG